MTHRTIRRGHQPLRRRFLRNSRASVFIQRHLAMRAMAGHAHTHRQRICLRNAIFSFNRAVTRLAFHAGRYMPTVIESDVVRQIVYFHPFDRFVLGQSRRDLLNLHRVFKNFRVAVHASARCRDAGYFGFVGRRMAVEALDLVITGMNLVRKIDWLSRLIALLVAETAKH